jgi:MFS family permease
MTATEPDRVAPAPERGYFAGLSKNTFLMAGGSLFADLSTEMLTPVLPIFLTQTLHANGSIVGLVDGVAQAVRNLIDGFSGSLSDRLRRRKAVALFGYALSALAKPVMGFSPAWEILLVGRLSDRLGAGIRSAPRDALVAASVDRRNRGSGFGLEGFGESAGAFLGPVLTMALLYALGLDLRTIFFLALVPGLLAFAMVLCAREQTPPAARAASAGGFRSFDARYWRYLLVIAVFGLGNSTNAFLILRTQDAGASLALTTLIYAGFNLLAALVAYPLGSLADRVGAKYLLLGSFVAFLITYLGLFFVQDLVAIAVLFVFCGLYQGVFRPVGRALASDLVPDHLRATGIGWYSATVGLSQLVASIVAGMLWDRVGHASVFLYGAAFSAAGIVALLLLVPRKPGQQTKASS